MSDAAVEYIDGIEVIKAFGKTESSYAKFTKAAMAYADSFISWMKRCSIFHVLMMVVTPYTLLTVLPFGAHYVENGTLTISDFIMQLEQGFDTIVGGAGGHLSGGERQRISIARDMPKDAPIVILDEATANVDPENEKELMDAVAALTKEKTIIMIDHRLKTVRHADRIVVVDKGRIVQQGTHEQLMQQEGIYRRFVDASEQAVSWKL